METAQNAPQSPPSATPATPQTSETAPSEPNVASVETIQGETSQTEDSTNSSRESGLNPAYQRDAPRTRKRKQLMLEALKKTHGIAVHAAPMAGIERSTHIRWMQKDATYRAKVEEFQEEALDRAEAVVEAAMAQQRERPDLALKSAVFLLENKGTRRGYGKAAINLQVNQAVSNAQAGPVFQIKQMLDEAAKKEAQNTSKQ